MLVFSLYPFIGIGVLRGSKEIFKNLESFTIYLVFSRVKVLALVLAKVVVLTLYLLYNNI